MEVAQIDELSVVVANIEIEKDKAESILKEIKERYKLAELELLAALTEAGKDKWIVDGIGTLSMNVSTYWNITDQEKALEYLKSTAPEQIKVNPTNIRGWATEYFEQHPDLDPATFGFNRYEKPRITLRRK